eukprot:702545-Rhodomonas_salina.1
MVPHSSKCDQGVGGCGWPTDDVWSVVLGRIYPPGELDTRQVSLERWRSSVWGARGHLLARTWPSGP